MAIFPNSERTLVANTLASPYLAICHIESEFPDGSVLQSTGVMVGLNDVVVAGHALFNSSLGGFVTKAQVIPGLNGSHKPTGIYDAIQAQVSDQWRIAEDYSHDYGLLTLSQPVGATTGLLNAGLISEPTEYLNQSTYTAGYPGDFGGQLQYVSSGTVDSFEAGIFYFDDDLSVSGGQSGSPLIFDHAQHGPLMLGLISHENLSPSANGVMLFNSDNWGIIQSWISNNDDSIANWQSQSSFSTEQIQQVNNLYQGILNRDADEEGAHNWLQHMQNGMSLETITGHFLNSEEYQHKNYFLASDNRTSIDLLYRNILDRQADQGGFDYWLEQHNLGMQLGNIIAAFICSDEYQQKEHYSYYELRYQWFDDYQLIAAGREDNDIITATSQDDKLLGQAGNDYLFAGEGDDWLAGGAGNDQLVGGAGADYFQLDHYDGELDTIYEFNLQEDRLVSSNPVGTVTGVDTAKGLLLNFSNNSNSVELVGLSTTDIGLIHLDIIGG